MKEDRTRRALSNGHNMVNLSGVYHFLEKIIDFDPAVYLKTIWKAVHRTQPIGRRKQIEERISARNDRIRWSLYSRH